MICFKVLAVDVLHDDILGGAILADIMDGDDIGMLQAGGGIGFLAEATQKIFVVGEAFMQHLYGDDPAEQQILAAVDDGHAAAADAVEELITAVEHPLFNSHEQILDRFLWSNKVEAD